jgi:hypothetical protein
LRKIVKLFGRKVKKGNNKAYYLIRYIKTYDFIKVTNNIPKVGSIEEHSSN